MLHSVDSDSATIWTVALQAPLSMDSPGRNTEVSCHALLQEIFEILGIQHVSCISKQVLDH